MNIYTGKKQFDLEDERLRSFAYPCKVSCHLLHSLIRAEATICDLGCGPSVELERYASEHGVVYFPLDLRKSALISKAATKMRAVHASVESLPFERRSMTISHMRFVLMHLPESSRYRAIKEALRITRECCIFLEYDWSSIDGPKPIRDFRAFAFDVLGKHMDLLYGSKLAVEVQSCVSSANSMSEQSFLRPPGNYTHELIDMAIALKGLLLQEQATLDGFISKFQELSAAAAHFSTARIVSVVLGPN